MARTHTPRASRSQADSRPPAAVRDFRGTAASYEIEWDVRTVYDFVISLSDDAGSTDDMPPADRRWLAEARAGLPESVRADRKALLGSELCSNIAELAVDRPDVRSPAAFVKAVRELDRRVRAMITRDVEARASEVSRLAPGDLIERVTGGVRYVPEPGIDRVILAPSYFTRPYNFLFSRDGWRLYAYPIADTALDIHDPLEPPLAIVRLHRALGDPSRLRILRLLADGDRYLTEIAQALELSKPTIKHHMAQLRAAGLVILTEEGALTYYSLRREGLDAVGVDLRRFIPG